LRPVINSEKHVVQHSLGTIASGSITNLSIAFAKAAPVAAVPQDCREGCVIKAVYVEMWIASDDPDMGTAIVTLERVPGGASPMTAAQSAALDSYANKKNIFHTQMGLIPNDESYPMATVKGWFKIPKGKQRFGISDRLILNIHAQSNGVEFCGVMIFKEQY